MRIAVFNEIGALKRVLVHRPGPELEQLTPPHLSRMLFDDSLPRHWLRKARRCAT